MTDYDYKPPALTIEIDGVTATGCLKLSFRAGESRLQDIDHPWPGLNPTSLTRDQVLLRKTLSDWSKQYNSFLVAGDEEQLQCDPEKIKPLLKALARWGRSQYRQFFDLQGRNSADLIQWSEDIKCLKGARIVIDSAIGDIPWGLFYDEEVPEDLGDQYISKMLEHFWVTQYELEVLPPYPRSCVLWKPVLNNNESTRLIVTINRDIKDVAARQQAFFEGVARQLNTAVGGPPFPLTLNYQKNEVIASIATRQEPQHLLYFFCHHKQAGGSWTPRGYRNFAEDTKMIIQGEDAQAETATISLSEMSENEDIKGFQSPPVVFLNACESAQVDIGDPSSFMLYFINMLKAYAFIGTEAEIPGAFAHAFGTRFVEEFLKGRPIGDILYSARRDFAQRYNNPFGLYYTLYGNGNVRLKQSLQRR